MTPDLIDAVGQLVALVLIVAAAVTPAVWRAHRMRRAVPGMSWRLAWRLTAPERTDR